MPPISKSTDWLFCLTNSIFLSLDSSNTVSSVIASLLTISSHRWQHEVHEVHLLTLSNCEGNYLCVQASWRTAYWEQASFVLQLWVDERQRQGAFPLQNLATSVENSHCYVSWEVSQTFLHTSQPSQHTGMSGAMDTDSSSSPLLCVLVYPLLLWHWHHAAVLPSPLWLHVYSPTGFSLDQSKRRSQCIASCCCQMLLV